MKKMLLMMFVALIAITTVTFAAFAASGPSDAVVQARAAVTLAENDVASGERDIETARAAIAPARTLERDAAERSRAHAAECRETFRRTQVGAIPWGPSGDAARRSLDAARRAHTACQEEQNRLSRAAALATTGVRTATEAVARAERIAANRRTRLERARTELAALEAAE